jgi:hypothetical protein
MEDKLKLFAFYLPQFHPISENDEWWGKGFTEWTNVTKAKSLYPGHLQPKLPSELGFYDLRVPEVMKEQARLAKTHGVNGFAFYHYWFGNGKVLLDLPIRNLLNDPSIEIEYCLCWTNESWKGTWHGAGNRLLIQQEYPGEEDYIRHFDYLLPFLKDSRYLRIDSKPVLQVYRPESIPDVQLFLNTFTKMALKNGLDGIYFLAVRTSTEWNQISSGFEGMVFDNFSKINKYIKNSFSSSLHRIVWNNPLIRKIFKLPKTIHYSTIRKCLEDFPEESQIDFFPLAQVNWDNTARAKEFGSLFLGESPSAFGEHLKACMLRACQNPNEKRIVFIRAWNEWAEGNYLEPDQINGRGYLEVIKKLNAFQI